MGKPGPGGPCGHCNATEASMWRKGPPEKPRLCNPCGVQYMTKKTLDGYMPGQKRGTRQPGDPPVKPKVQARPVKRKAPSPELHRTPDRPQREIVKRQVEDKFVPMASTNRKRKQSKPQQAMPSTPQARLKGQQAAAAAAAAAGVRSRIGTREAFGKKSRMTSVKVSIELTKAMDDDGEFATPRKRPPKVPKGETGSSSGRKPAAPFNILEQLPYRKRDVLFSIESPLAHVDLSDIVTHEVFSSLGEEEQAQMLRLLSPADCSSSGGCSSDGAEEAAEGGGDGGAVNDVNLTEGMKAMFGSQQFLEWMSRYQSLLSAGMFDQGAPGMNPRVHEHFKKLLEVTDLNKTNWKDTMPSQGGSSSRRGGRGQDQWKQAHYEGYYGERRQGAGAGRGGEEDGAGAEDDDDGDDEHRSEGGEECAEQSVEREDGEEGGEAMEEGAADREEQQEEGEEIVAQEVAAAAAAAFPAVLPASLSKLEERMLGTPGGAMSAVAAGH